MNLRQISSGQPADVEAESPFDVFSHCHTGLMAHMQDLGRLPELLQGAALARSIAAETLRLFRTEVREHHAEEEGQLFSAVLAYATEGDERDNIAGIVRHLVDEHRHVESEFARLEFDLERVASGQDVGLDVASVTALADAYHAHAVYEEAVFMPLAHDILGRDDRRLEALRVALKSRPVVRELMQRLVPHA